MRSCALALVLALLAACGGTAKPKASPVPTDDAGRARLLVLTQADLPDGWHATRHRIDPVASREEVKLAKCIGAPNPATSQTADVFGDVFGQGAQTITSEVVIFRRSADGSRATAAVKDARALSCARASVRPVLAEQLRLQGLTATIRSIAVTRRALPVRGFVSAFRVVVDLAASGAVFTVDEDVVVLARGRTQVRATFVDVGVAFPATLQLSVMTNLSTKLFAS